MGTNVIALLATILIQQAVVDNPAILEIRVIEGEGVVYPLGGRATRGVTVQVTDETGKPIEDVAVSFRLPDEGPSGAFANGSKTEVVTTKADGKASVWGMQWNHGEGQFEIRITASKGTTRAGTVCSVYLSKEAKETGSSPIRLARNHKWLWITVAVAGAAGVAVAAAAMGGKGSEPIGPTVTPTTIGTPSISIGHP